MGGCHRCWTYWWQLYGATHQLSHPNAESEQRSSLCRSHFSPPKHGEYTAPVSDIWLSQVAATCISLCDDIIILRDQLRGRLCAEHQLSHIDQLLLDQDGWRPSWHRWLDHTPERSLEFMAAGADLNLRDKYEGTTALMIAAASHCDLLIEALVRSGADVMNSADKTCERLIRIS